MPITWNPSDKDPGIILSNGDLTADGNDGDYCAVRATISKSSGKWYWECTLDGSQLNYHYFGIGTSAEDLDQYPGYTVEGYSLRISSGGARYLIHNNVATAYGTGGSLSNVIGMAFDLDNGEIWFSLNGVWIQSGNPVTRANPAFSGISGTFFPMVGLYAGTGTNLTTAKFTVADQSHSPPSGFNALNTLINLFDGKVSISPKIDLLDGKTSISPKTTVLDGKARVKSSTTKLLDGKSWVTNLATNLLDGKGRIKDVATNLVDGKVRIKDTAIELFDGKAKVKDVTTNIFDGKVLLNPVIIGDLILPLFNMEAISGPNAFLDESFSIFEVEAFTGGVVDLTLPFFDLEGTAKVGEVVFADIDLPSLAIEALTGTKGLATLPSLACTGTALVSIGALGEIELPLFQVDAEALVNILATLEASLPMLQVSAEGIEGILAVGDINLWLLHLVAEGLVGPLATGDISLPFLTVEGDSFHELTGVVDIELPRLSLLARASTLFKGCEILRYNRWE